MQQKLEELKQKKEVLDNTIDKINNVENYLFLLGIITGVITASSTFTILPYYFSLIASLIIELLIAGSVFTTIMIPSMIYKHKKIKELGFKNYKELKEEKYNLEYNMEMEKRQIEYLEKSMNDDYNNLKDTIEKSISSRPENDLIKIEDNKNKIKVKKLTK